MKKISTGSIALAAIIGSAGVASAADLYATPPPIESPIYSPAPIYNWTGFYAGVSGGYGSGNAVSSNTPFDGSVKGFFAGGQLGYNVQLQNNIVLGVEADANWSGIKGTINPSSPTITQSIGWFGTLRGRAGYAFGNVLPYVTGGFAFGSATRTSTIGSSTESLGVTGYALGGGVEVGLGNNWSVKGEYQYLNFGSKVFSNIPADPNVKLDAHTIRLGVNYRF